MFRPIGSASGEERTGYLSRLKSFYDATGLPYTELQGKKVLLLGAGLIGSHVALLLSRLPITLTIVDDDRVGWENIAYQLFLARSVGQAKAKALAELLVELGHPAETRPQVLRLPNICSIANGKENIEPYRKLAESHDIIVDTLDDTRYRQTAWLLAWLTKRPIVSAAYWSQHGVVAASPDPKGYSLWCLWSRIAGPERVNYHADPLLVAAAAALAARAVYGLLAGTARGPLHALLEPARSLYTVEQSKPIKCMEIKAKDAREAAREMLERSVINATC